MQIFLFFFSPPEFIFKILTHTGYITITH